MAGIVTSFCCASRKAALAASRLRDAGENTTVGLAFALPQCRERLAADDPFVTKLSHYFIRQPSRLKRNRLRRVIKRFSRDCRVSQKQSIPLGSGWNGAAARSGIHALPPVIKVDLKATLADAPSVLPSSERSIAWEIVPPSSSMTITITAIVTTGSSHDSP